ncbi:hypothetical protein OKA05_19370 [Luteolibacter arcticus]|uniref:Uncharacterized protein n=1 Tax=Luteolibacter arcticus TaxID=1581411 RepID=A0ABT3GMI1_9BACT|nr:hypothetical protein [Luteolibacter arcticus]MCW1924734.1 hypothetical protein [Luteolibacter arcticus]
MAVVSPLARGSDEVDDMKKSLAAMEQTIGELKTRIAVLEEERSEEQTAAEPAPAAPPAEPAPAGAAPAIVVPTVTTAAYMTSSSPRAGSARSSSMTCFLPKR